ncbi:VWA domain-containing protein [uncultured Anaerococcus sp.]|uniref:vWA domain-containing protein n=1 Tax=uncultured Anaerococcus sp. TaxID=293428 RepID=UPI00288A7805|nr:VWA domain-containing protein [uncultured Anaerococcus sp.]
MDRTKEKLYENRISNIQWAGARDYSFDNFIIGENIDGNPDFYINLIIGLAIKYLGKNEIQKLFDAWAYNFRRDKYDLALLYILEDFAYKKEISQRPVLKSLRIAYAQKFLDDKYDLQRRNLALRQNTIYRLELLRMGEILGKNTGNFSKKDLDLYKKLCLPSDTDKSNIESRVINLFNTYLGYRESDLLKKLPSLNLSLFESAGMVSLERSNMPANFAGKSQKSHGFGSLILDFKMKKRRESLAYIEKTFGKSLFDEKIRLGIERDLCTGGHKKSRLFYTRGITENDKDLDQDLNKKAIARHLLKFKANKTAYTRAISVLSKEIKLKLNLTSSLDDNLASRGKLVPRLAYKAEITDRAKIFKKKSLQTDPNIRVDLLVDGSASLLEKESEVAIEAYILAKSLENNSILNRVISFQTLGDFTILTILKDYNEKTDIKKIFRFKAMGWNRDGLVFRAYRAILDKDFKNTLSLILTDANPQDLKPLITEGFRLNKPYQDQVGLDDTKKNLADLRKKGLKIGAILSGDHVENAREIYRSNFIKIDKPTSIASDCGKFIKNQISSLEK